MKMSSARGKPVQAEHGMSVETKRAMRVPAERCCGDKPMMKMGGQKKVAMPMKRAKG